MTNQFLVTTREEKSCPFCQKQVSASDGQKDRHAGWFHPACVREMGFGGDVEAAFQSLREQPGSGRAGTVQTTLTPDHV